MWDNHGATIGLLITGLLFVALVFLLVVLTEAAKTAHGIRDKVAGWLVAGYCLLGILMVTGVIQV